MGWSNSLSTPHIQNISYQNVAIVIQLFHFLHQTLYRDNNDIKPAIELSMLTAQAKFCTSHTLNLECGCGYCKVK